MLNPFPSAALPPGTRYVRPPYIRISPLPDPGAFSPSPGDVVLIELAKPLPVPELYELRDPVAHLRRHGLAVAMRFLQQGTGTDIVINVMHAHEVGVRACLVGGESGPEALWRCLSLPVGLARDWVSLVKLHARPQTEVSPFTAACCQILIDAADRYDSVGELLEREEFGCSESTVRRRLRREGLPKPERWYNGARHVRAQFDLQCDRAASRFGTARKLGYSDWESLSNTGLRLFGITTAAALKLLGLEWRIRAWWDRSRR